MNNFTFEEINLMCIYNSGDGTRQELIEALTEMRGYLSADETELLELTDSALKKPTRWLMPMAVWTLAACRLHGNS